MNMRHHHNDQWQPQSQSQWQSQPQSVAVNSMSNFKVDTRTATNEGRQYTSQQQPYQPHYTNRDRPTTHTSPPPHSFNMGDSNTHHDSVDGSIDGNLKMNERKSLAKMAEPLGSNANSWLDHAQGESSGATSRNNRNNNNHHHNFNNFKGNGRPRQGGKSKHRVTADAPLSATFDEPADAPDGTWDSSDSFFPATSNQRLAKQPSTSILPYNITLNKCPKYRFSEAGYQTAQINALLAKVRQPDVGFVGNIMMRNSPTSRAPTSNPAVVPDVKAEQSEVPKQNVVTIKNDLPIPVSPHLDAKSEESEVVLKRTTKFDLPIFVPPHLRTPVPKMSAIHASLKITSGQKGKSADADPSTALSGEAANKSVKPATAILSSAANAEVSNKVEISADTNPITASNAELSDMNGKLAKGNLSVLSNADVADTNGVPVNLDPSVRSDAKISDEKAKLVEPNPSLSVHEDDSNIPLETQKSPKGKEPAIRELESAPAPVDTRSNVSQDSQLFTADAKYYKKYAPTVEHSLAGWDGKWQPPPVEWGARPSFDPKEKHHVQSIHAWLQERAGEHLTNPVTLDTKDPRFETGEASAAGETKLLDPIDSKDHETILPNDDFTKAKFHVTAADAQKNHRPRITVEKNGQHMTKAERRAYREAVKEARANFVPRPNPHVPKANIYIRPAEAKDLQQITAIYNHWIEHSVVVPEREQHNESQWRGRWIDATESNFAFLVAVQLSAKGGGNNRRTSQETICGFAYADDFGDNHNAYRYTCEMQVYVGNWTLRMGVGKSLVDRMMAALDNCYHPRGGVKFDGGENYTRYEGGGVRMIHKVLINIPYAAKDDSTLKWQKEWLSKWHFEQVGMLPGIGRKFDKV